MEEDRIARIEGDPRFVALVRERARFGWTLASIVVAAFAAYILVIALDKALFATPIAGLTATWGIPAGLALILLAITSIALFTHRANTRYDPAMAAILADHAA